MTWRWLILLLTLLASVSAWSRLSGEGTQPTSELSPGPLRTPSPEPPWAHPPALPSPVHGVTLDGVALGMTRAQVVQIWGPPGLEMNDGGEGYGEPNPVSGHYPTQISRHVRAPEIVALVIGRQLQGDGQNLMPVPAHIAYSELEQCLGRPDQVVGNTSLPVTLRLRYTRLSLHLTIAPLDSLDWPRTCPGCDNPHCEQGRVRTSTSLPDGDFIPGVGPLNATCYWWAQGCSWERISDAWLRRHDFLVTEAYLGDDDRSAASRSWYTPGFKQRRIR